MIAVDGAVAGRRPRTDRPKDGDVVGWRHPGQRFFDDGVTRLLERRVAMSIERFQQRWHSRFRAASAVLDEPVGIKDETGTDRQVKPRRRW
jgi:hypothetical protein